MIDGLLLTKVFPLITDVYLKLEDVTHKFNKPCIMDVKIGRKSYDPFASSEKIQQQVSKYPLMEEIGFLVLGMRVRVASVRCTCLPYTPLTPWDGRTGALCSWVTHEECELRGLGLYLLLTGLWSVTGPDI